MKRWTLTVLAALAANFAWAAERDDLDAGAKLPVSESHVTAKLSANNPRRLFIGDTAFPAAQAAKTWIVNGDKGEIEGMFAQAYWPNFAIAPGGKELYSVDSFWEKHTRGKRQDFLTVRDAQTLAITGEVPLPNGRLIVVTKKYNFDVTPDGHYGFVYNLAPRTSVSVVDLPQRKLVGEIDVAGCGLVFAQGNNRFSTLCADGSVATVTFDGNLKTTSERLNKAFDAQKDPAFEHSAWDRHHSMLYLITYSGQVVPLDLSGSVAKKQEVWALASASEREHGWRPGGWQVSHFHSASQRMYVLMHRGHDWTHKESGTEVWVFDVLTKKRVQRIKLKDKAQSVAVSQDASPLVYTIAESTDILTYDGATGRAVSKIDKLGFSPQILTVPGE